MRLTSSKSERWIEAVVAQVHVLQARSGQAESYWIAIGFGPRQQLERRSFLSTKIVPFPAPCAECSDAVQIAVTILPPALPASIQNKLMLVPTSTRQWVIAEVTRSCLAPLSIRICAQHPTAADPFLGPRASCSSPAVFSLQQIWGLANAFLGVN